MSAHETTPAVEPGALYVVATPIGHLGDLGKRAAGVLAEVDWVAAEDTRVSGTLLARLGSRARKLAAHQHNEASAAAHIVALLADGQSVALVTDAGTPGVSDPGARIVSAVHEAGRPVIPIPGPSAVTAMASASGLIEGPFRFEGFLPSRMRQRAERLRALATSDCPVILFEAPHRIEATLAAIVEQLGGDRWIVLGRELTKKFEEIHRCLSGAAPDWVRADPMRRKGEYVVAIAPANFRLPGSGATRGQDCVDPDEFRSAKGVIAPAPANRPGADPSGPAAEPGTLTLDLDRLLGALVAEIGVSRATRIVEQVAGLPHRQVYTRALRLAKQDEGVDSGGGA